MRSDVIFVEGDYPIVLPPNDRRIMQKPYIYLFDCGQAVTAKSSIHLLSCRVLQTP